MIRILLWMTELLYTHSAASVVEIYTLAFYKAHCDVAYLLVFDSVANYKIPIQPYLQTQFEVQLKCKTHHPAMSTHN